MRNLKREPSHPGRVLNEDFLKPMGLSQTVLANRINTTFRTVNEIVNEKRNISPEMAIKLSRFFGTSAELWLNLQNQYDLFKISAGKAGMLERIKPYEKSHGKAA